MLGLALIHIYIHIYIHTYIHTYQRQHTPLDLAIENEKEEGLAAGQDVNARDLVIFLFVCVCVCVCVEVASLVCKSFVHALLVKHSLDQTISYPSKDVLYYLLVCVFYYH